MIDADKRRLLERQAEVVRSLAHPIRLAIADFLKGGEQCVSEIADHVGAERSNVSRHLAVMVKAGILSCRKEGLKVIYSLKCPCILEFFTCIGTVLREQAKEHQKLLAAM